MQSDPRAARSQRWKTRLAGGVLALAVLLLTGLLNLPYPYVERNGTWFGNRQFADSDANRNLERLPTMAGWPNRYWVRYQFVDRSEDRYWSTQKLFTNLGIGMALAVIVFSFTQIRQRAIVSASNRRLVRLSFDVSVAIAILFVPLSLYALAQRTKTQHWQLIGQASRFGNCYTSAWLPEPIATSLPAGLVDVLSRVRHVKLIRPDAEIVRRVLAVETLTGFHFEGSKIDAAALDALSSNAVFFSVRLLRCDLDEQFVDSLAKHRWLVELHLRDTNLNTQMFHQFDSMQNLRWVDLLGTQVQLSQLGKPDWSSTVEVLHLPRPDDATDVTLTIDGWPRLKSLAVIRRTRRLNDSTLTLRLSHLPSLEILFLDRVQKHALFANDLPQLRRIDEDVAELFFELSEGEIVPGLTWLSELHFDDVPNLKKLGCFGRDLETLTINKMPNLRRLEIGSYLVIAQGATLETVDSSRCQTWIDNLGAGDGPVMVDLSALPLADIDLFPLVGNPRIRHLRFGNTGVSFEQIKRLKGMTQLEKLDLNDFPLEQGQLDWLLEHFPKLTDLHVDVGKLDALQLTRTSNLRQLRITRFQQLRDLQIVNAPDLDCYLHLVRAPERMLIRNAPSIRGIAVEQPWPRDTEVNGLRDLEWFSGGGPELNDAVVDALLTCPSIDRLTLAYASVSPERLSKFGRFTRLSSLILPGLPIDDRVTANWKKLAMLQELNLDGSSVSAETFAWLSGIDSLRRLSINRVELSDAAAARVADLLQLSELAIADVPEKSQALIPLLQGDNLERLDISGWRLDSDLVGALARSQSIKSLTMHRCQLSSESLRQIVTGNPLLRIDLGEQTENYSAEIVATLEHRAEHAGSPSVRSPLNVILSSENSFEVVEDEVDHSKREEATNTALPRRRTDDAPMDQLGYIDPERFRQSR